MRLSRPDLGCCAIEKKNSVNLQELSCNGTVLYFVIIVYLSWSWATCWPAPVSRIQKSLQRSTMVHFLNLFFGFSWSSLQNLLTQSRRASVRFVISAKWVTRCRYKYISARTFHISPPICVIFGRTQLQIMSMRNFEFHENQCSERHTLRKELNKNFPYFFKFFVRLE
jgi:hypothetical protein